MTRRTVLFSISGLLLIVIMIVLMTGNGKARREENKLDPADTMQTRGQQDSPAPNPGRSYPSIFQAWNEAENHEGYSAMQNIARHDLYFDGTWGLEIGWRIDASQPYEGLAVQLDPEYLENAKRAHDRLKVMNPHIKLLCAIDYREGHYVPADREGPEFWEVGILPPDSEFWLKDRNGMTIPGWGEDDDHDGILEEQEVRSYLFDFLNEDFQNLIAAKAEAVFKSGLYDGIFLDWWSEQNATTGSCIHWDETVYTVEQETEARIAILKKIRKRVDDDFLILVNANNSPVPSSSAYVNGLFMESYKPDPFSGYDMDQILKVENTLVWAENNLREPRINCLEGWSVVSHYGADREGRILDRNSEENQRWMRLFTAMALTLSDGYVLFSDDNAQPSDDHLHNWYSFWDADLGTPVSDKGVAYDHTPGLFIREFSNGYAVYNRTLQAQIIRLPQSLTGVHSKTNSNAHVIPPMDGEILVKDLLPPPDRGNEQK